MITPLYGSRDPPAGRIPPPPAAPGAWRVGDTGGRKVSQGHRGLLGIRGGQHDTDPAAQVVQVQPPRSVVLAQKRDQALAGRGPERRTPSGRRTSPVLAHADGVTTTALP